MGEQAGQHPNSLWDVWWEEPRLTTEPASGLSVVRGSCLNKPIFRLRWIQLHTRNPRQPMSAGIADLVLLVIRNTAQQDHTPAIWWRQELLRAPDLKAERPGTFTLWLP